MHIPDMNEILLVFRMSAEGVLPLVDELEDLGHSRWGEDGGAFGESAD